MGLGGDLMKLNNIKITNYRCFKEISIDFDEHTTLIVGRNGAGKTAILDAVAVSISTFLLGIDGAVSRTISKDDARYEFHDLEGTIDPQHQFPVSVDSRGDCLDKKNIKWVRSLNSEHSKTTIKDAAELTDIAKEVQNRIMTGDKSLILPLVSYYGTGRLYAQKKEKRNIQSLTEFKRQVGYVDCMAAESNEKLMLNWFQIQTLKSLQEQQKTGILDKPMLLKTVEKAICKCFERISGSKNTRVFFDLDTHKLVLEFENEDGNAQKFAMDEMSDGYKNTLSMIGDIAYRMAVLNPVLGNMVLEKTPGVILIDEIDLHLHPQWQQTILSDLNAIFPNIQFIVTTHSPLVITNVQSSQLRILSSTDGNVNVLRSAGSYALPVSVILKDVMGITNELPYTIEKVLLPDLYKSIHDGDIDKAKQMCSELESLSPDFPDLVKIRKFIEIKRRSLQ